MYIPDPIELMESRQEDLMWEWEEKQKRVPEGSFRCPYCLNIFSYEPIQCGGSPDSPFTCYDCLPNDLKEAYDNFQDNTPPS